MPTLVSPSGKRYAWTKSTPPTQDDIDALLASEGGASEPAPAPESDPGMNPNALAMAAARAGGGGFGTTMAIPAKDQIAAQAKYVRAVPPLVAGAITAPLSIPAAAAISGAAGFAGNFGSQAMENISGDRAGFSAGEAAADTLQAAAPVGRFGGVLKNAIANAAIQGGASAAADVLRGEDPSAMKTGIAGVVGAAAPAASELLARAIRGVGALAAGGTLKEAGAEALRPAELTPAQVRGQKARDTIEKITGVRPETQLSESIGAPEITRQMNLAPNEDIIAAQRYGDIPERLAAPEATAEDTARITKLVSELGAKIKRSGATPADVSEGVFNELKAKGVEINNDVIDAVNSYAGVPKGLTGELFPGVRENKASGDDLRQLVQMVKQGAKSDYDAVYGAARSLPNASAVRVQGSPVETAANSIGLSLATDPTTGGFVVIGGSPTTRGVAASGSSLPSQMTLDQARTMSSDLGRRIEASKFSAPKDAHDLGIVKRALDSEIESGMKPYPEVEKAFNYADALYHSDVGRFRSNAAIGMLQQIGQEGGDVGEKVAGWLTGPQGASNLEEILKVAGQGSKAGTDASPEATKLVREMYLSNARSKASDSGQIIPRRAVELIEELPDSVRSKLFQDYKQMRAAVDEQAKKLSGLGIDKLPAQPAGDVHEFLLNPDNAKVADRAMRVIETKNPTLAQDVRGLFLDELFSKSKGDPAEISTLLARPRATGAAPTASAGGKYANSSEAILGKRATDDLREIASSLQEIPSARKITPTDQRGFWNWILTGNTGNSIFSSNNIGPFVERVIGAAPAIRYRVAAYILTDEKLRRQVMNPTGDSMSKALQRAIQMSVNDELNRK